MRILPKKKNYTKMYDVSLDIFSVILQCAQGFSQGMSSIKDSVRCKFVCLLIDFQYVFMFSRATERTL